MGFSYSPPHRIPGCLVPGKIYYEKEIEGVKVIEGIKGRRFNRIFKREKGFCELALTEASRGNEVTKQSPRLNRNVKTNEKKEPPAKLLTCTFPETSGIFCQLNYGGPC